MGKRKTIFLIGITLLLLLPQIVFAASKSRVIFGFDLLTSTQYRASPNQWQITNNSDEGLYAQEDGSMLLKSDGDPTLVYPISFNNQEFDQLVITVMVDRRTDIRLISDITTTGKTSFLFNKNVTTSQDFKVLTYSLRDKIFDQINNDIGINFSSLQPTTIVIKEIKLKKLTAIETLAQAVKDYFTVAPYQPFTVNLIPTPLIFSTPAMAYFFPLILILLWLLVKSDKWQKTAAIVLLLLWLGTDLRMVYEFISHNIFDYQTWVAPASADKTLRNYDDFYVFTDWLKKNLPDDAADINFYNFGSVHFPRLLLYNIYPVTLGLDETDSDIYVAYNRSDIFFNSDDSRVYLLDQPLSQPGEIIASYNNKSFIFQQNAN